MNELIEASRARPETAKREGDRWRWRFVWSERGGVRSRKDRWNRRAWNRPWRGPNPRRACTEWTWRNGRDLRPPSEPDCTSTAGRAGSTPTPKPASCARFCSPSRFRFAISFFYCFPLCFAILLSWTNKYVWDCYWECVFGRNFQLQTQTRFGWNKICWRRNGIEMILYVRFWIAGSVHLGHVIESGLNPVRFSYCEFELKNLPV